MKRAINIISALVDFSKMAKVSLNPEDINSILEQCLVLVQEKLRLENIKIVKKLQRDLPKVLVDKV
ncbi:hypothetical protein ACFL2G_04170, partial [Candidatus Omnitrophota bacterium]